MIKVIKTGRKWQRGYRCDSVTIGNERLWNVRIWPLFKNYPTFSDREKGLALDIHEIVVKATSKSKAIKIAKAASYVDDGQSIEAKSLMVYSEVK